MALLTACWNTRCCVVRRLGLIEVFGMATVAIHWCTRKPTGVAAGTFNCFVLAFQREVRLTVIETGFTPALGSMTHCAVRRETLRHMIRCTVVLRFMTTKAIGAGGRQRALMTC